MDETDGFITHSIHVLALRLFISRSIYISKQRYRKGNPLNENVGQYHHPTPPVLSDRPWRAKEQTDIARVVLKRTSASYLIEVDCN